MTLVLSAVLTVNSWIIYCLQALRKRSVSTQINSVSVEMSTFQQEVQSQLNKWGDVSLTSSLNLTGRGIHRAYTFQMPHITFDSILKQLMPRVLLNYFYRPVHICHGHAKVKYVTAHHRLSLQLVCIIASQQHLCLSGTCGHALLGTADYYTYSLICSTNLSLVFLCTVFAVL